MSPCMWTAQDLQPRLGVIWKELNPCSTTLIEQINKNIQSPEIHVFDIHPTCTLVPGEGEGAHPLSALAHGKSDTLPCCDRPHAFYHSLYAFLFRVILVEHSVSLWCVCGLTGRRRVMGMTLVSPRPFSCALLSLRSAAACCRAPRSLCHNCSIYPGEAVEGKAAPIDIIQRTYCWV